MAAVSFKTSDIAVVDRVNAPYDEVSRVICNSSAQVVHLAIRVGKLICTECLAKVI